MPIISGSPVSEVGLVKYRAEGRRRYYRLDHDQFQPLDGWLAKYQQHWSERLDRLDDFLGEIQKEERE